MVVSSWVDAAVPREHLLPDQISLLAHLTPSGLALTSAKTFWSVFIQRVTAVHKKIDEMPEAEVDNIDMRDIFYPSRAHHPLNYWTDVWPKFRAGLGRDVAITTTLRLFEHVAVWALPYKPARQLVKNTWASAVRKSHRFAGAPRLAGKVFPMALRSQSLYWLATYTVLVLVDAWHERDWKIFVTNCRKTLFKCAASAVVAACGAVVGTWVKPGPGTQIGVVLAPQLVWVLVK